MPARLAAPTSPARLCDGCGVRSRFGRHGTGAYEGQWFCRRCWQGWEAPSGPGLRRRNRQRPIPQEAAEEGPRVGTFLVEADGEVMELEVDVEWLAALLAQADPEELQACEDFFNSGGMATSGHLTLASGEVLPLLEAGPADELTFMEVEQL